MGSYIFLTNFIRYMTKAKLKLSGPILNLYKMLKNFVASATRRKIVTALKKSKMLQ